MNKYEIIEPIGRGSFGSVYRVRHVVNNKEYALKRVHYIERRKNDLDYLRNEIRILVYNKAKYLIKCHDIFVDQMDICLVTDLASKGDLRNFIKRRKRRNMTISENTIIKLFVQLCLGIKYLHNYNIIHRDLKSANILINNNYDVMIGDFGISKILRPSVKFTHTMIGTPYYCSPEIVKGVMYDKRVDIWALGCILCEMMTMDYAFISENIHSLNFKIINGKYQLPDRVKYRYSDELVDLVSKMIDTDINKRPDIDQILSFDIIKDFINNNEDDYHNHEVRRGLNKYLIKPRNFYEWGNICKQISMDLVFNDNTRMSPLTIKRPVSEYYNRRRYLPKIYS